MSEVVGITIGHECPGKTKWVDPKKARGTVAKFRKKPVVIEAIVAANMGVINTLEGSMAYSEGDFIITGIKGEQYPCKPDIFRATYEAVDHDGQVLLNISEGMSLKEIKEEFVPNRDLDELRGVDFPKEQKLKVDPLSICEFCPSTGTLYPWAVSQTTNTLMLCRECWEKEAGMTVEEMWPLNEKSENEG